MEKVGQSNVRMAWVDNIRMFAIVAVVFVHVSAYGVSVEYNSECRANGNWWITNFYESLCRCCVPLFVMLTGSLLLPQQIKLGEFLKKRLSRILLPFAFWSVIYIGFNFGLKFKNGSHASVQQIIAWLSDQIFMGAEFHLWYVYMLIGLYLIIPILQPWVATASNRALAYFIGICLASIALTQFGISSKTLLDLRYFGGYVGFLVMGYYISDRIVITAKIIIAALICFAAGFFVTFAGTYVMSNRANLFNDELYNYLTLNVIILSVGAFILIKNGAVENSAVNNIRNILSKYGFSIYLCHPLVLITMAHFKINYKFVNPLLGIPLTTAICIIVTCSLVYILSKLPYGKYISG